jgi:hypothetical protein
LPVISALIGILILQQSIKVYVILRARTVLREATRS